jgi:hypothetical protein
MIKTEKLMVVIVLLVTLSLCTGCSRGPKRPDDMPKLTTCVVFVSFGGEMMQGVSVYLTPEDRQVNKWGAGGLTDDEGKAVLKTNSTFEGVVPGNYIISFRKLAEPVDMNTPPSLIPDQYTLGQSKETIVVSTEQRQYRFELEGLK